MALGDLIREHLTGQGKCIVLPEGSDPRIVAAAVRLHKEGIVKPILIGTEEEVTAAAESQLEDATSITRLEASKDENLEELVAAFVERRKGKIDEAGARELILNDPNYYATMLVFTGRADGMVSGAIHSTGETIRPALQIIKMKPGFRNASGSFIMMRDDELYIFGDCGVTINPTPEQLAEIAKLSADTAQSYGLDPKVAMLSFSTKGSAVCAETEKVLQATKLAQEQYPELCLDGELQFDAAFVPKVGKLKAPNSPVAGQANVFVFPTLDAGNIGYKIAQRFGNFTAIGPILQGLNAPVNDLSRGCSSDDAYKLSLITAHQALTQ